MMLPLYLLFCLCPQPEAIPLPREMADPFVGVWLCDGRQDGRRYRAVVVITREESAYLVQTQVVGGSPSLGVGAADGDALAIGWKQGQAVGVTVWRVQPDGSLAGSWRTLAEGPWPETLRLLTRLPRLAGET